MEENNFLSKLARIDDKSVETITKFVYPSDFKEKTGIHHNRMANIVKSEGKDVTLEEMKKIVDYYRGKTGKEVKFEDLFPMEE